MQCEHCGAEFDRRNVTQRFCSEKCRRVGDWVRARARGYKAPSRYTFVCKCCGKEYQTAYKDRDTYCSRDCAFKDKERRCACGASLRGTSKEWCDQCGAQSKRRTCAICGVTFESTRARRYCSDECFKEKKRRRAAYYDKLQFEAQVKPRECKQCGRVFTPEFGDGNWIYCSKRCGKKAGEKYKAKGNHQQRAKHYGVRYEWFSDLVVLRRDGWRCYICGCSTPRELRGTYEDNAPEIDHIIPLSRGGTHTKDNVRCCCRACNGAKADMMLKEMRQAHINQAVQVALL